MKKMVASILFIALLISCFSHAFAYDTLKPGSKGQAVLDARMKLYELGYFSKKPTQTEYTNNMMDYVKKFEKDYGLEQDGILSPEDQMVLFGDPQSGSAFEPIAVSDQLQIDGIFINEAYADKNQPSMTELVVCYTLTSTGKNYNVVGNEITLTFTGGNQYQSSHIQNECLYLGSYYYGSNYVKTVYYGEKFHMVDTIRIPKGELASGREFTLSNSHVSDMNLATLSTDQIISCRNMEAIAKIVDPDGYAQRKHALTEADSSTKNKARKYMNGYYWDFYVNRMSYRIDFAKSTYTLRCMGIKTTGKYTICNGYIILTNDSTGYKNYLPYTFMSNDINLDITTGFDLAEN